MAEAEAETMPVIIAVSRALVGMHQNLVLRSSARLPSTTHLPPGYDAAWASWTMSTKRREDMRQQSLVINSSVRQGFIQSFTEAATSHLEHATHNHGVELVSVIPDESVLHLGSPAKYRAAFLNYRALLKSDVLGPQRENLVLGFDQLSGLFIRLVQFHGLNPFVETVS